MGEYPQQSREETAQRVSLEEYVVGKLADRYGVDPTAITAEFLSQHEQDLEQILIEREGLKSIF